MNSSTWRDNQWLQLGRGERKSNPSATEIPCCSLQLTNNMLYSCKKYSNALTAIGTSRHTCLCIKTDCYGVPESQPCIILPRFDRLPSSPTVPPCCLDSNQLNKHQQLLPLTGKSWCPRAVKSEGQDNPAFYLGVLILLCSFYTGEYLPPFWRATEQNYMQNHVCITTEGI